jgi:SAM-dependent methyltransferase
LDADHYDRWYADMAGSSRRDEIVRRELGLPPEMQSTSLLGWDGIADVVAALELTDGEVLLDLACGRGGYGLEIARRTGTRLIGVDFSAVAIGQAERRAEAFGLADRATFRVGEMAGTGLADASVDAVVCVDAVQLLDPVIPALRECRRVLAPGGRLAITTWEPADRADERLPERIRRLDLARGLAEAGLVAVVVIEKPDWRRAEWAMWQAALAEDAGDDPALRSMRDEAERVLPAFDAVRRVLATGRAPSGSG